MVDNTAYRGRPGHSSEKIIRNLLTLRANLCLSLLVILI